MFEPHGLVEAPEERALIAHRAATHDGAVLHNLSQMNGSMMRLLRNESLGGNAGRVNLGGRYYSCAAAHGYADPLSGRIVAFGNVQDIPLQKREGNAEFIMKAAFGGLRFFRIVQFLANGGGASPELSPGARDVLEESVQQWNDTSQRGTMPC
jgi:hypothetical protein